MKPGYCGVIMNRMVVQKDFQTLLQAHTSDLTTSSFFNQHSHIYLHEIHMDIGASATQNHKSSHKSSKVDRRIGVSMTFSRSSKFPYQRCKKTLQGEAKNHNIVALF